MLVNIFLIMTMISLLIVVEMRLRVKETVSLFSLLFSLCDLVHHLHRLRTATVKLAGATVYCCRWVRAFPLGALSLGFHCHRRSCRWVRHWHRQRFHWFRCCHLRSCHHQCDSPSCPLIAPQLCSSCHHWLHREAYSCLCREAHPCCSNRHH